MIDVTSPQELKRCGGWSIVFGVALLVAGLLAIAAPLLTGVAVEILVGTLIIVAGIVQLGHAMNASQWSARLVAFIGGLLAVACGILLLAHPLAGLSFLTLLLAAYFFIDGFVEIAFSIKARPMPGSGWLLVGGIVTLLFGVLIWTRWPLSGAWAVGTLVGVSILFVGAGALNQGVAARRHAREMESHPTT